MEEFFTDIGSFAVLVGGLWVFAAIYFSVEKIKFIKSSQKTIGTIADTFFPKASDGSASTIKIQFMTTEGDEQTFTEQPLRGAHYPLASEVEVIYSDKQYIRRYLFFSCYSFLFFSAGIKNKAQ